MGRTLANQPGRRLLQQGGDIVRGERLGDLAASESGVGDSELVRDDRTRVRTGLAQFHQPLRWVGDHLVELLARDRLGLEGFGGGREVDPEFLRRCRGLHGLGGFRRGHAPSVA